jgi:hypothetical protein
MKAASVSIYSDLAAAYRATFQEYSDKLEALQRLMGSDNSGKDDRATIEATLLEVETARVAHSCARDRLARELLRTTSALAAAPARGVRQSHIRDIAQLMWELAGRPEGTAEGDWQKAEKLVQRAATAC